MSAMKGLLAVLAKPKGSDEEDAPASHDAGASEDALIDEAYEAMRDGDKAGFREAFRAAVRACVEADDKGEYDDKG